jgi:dienelactone hydrolase
MPDFFEGKPADISWYPPDNKEKETKLGEFFQTQAAPPKTLPRVPKIVQELSKSRGIEKWAVIGFCWGGKVCLHAETSDVCSADMILDCQPFLPRKHTVQSRSRMPPRHGRR